MAFALQLDAFNFDENEGPTEDPLLAGLLMMPIDAQIHEVSLSLLRHHISKSTHVTPGVLETFERIYPRTSTSITNKKVLWRLLGIDSKLPPYNDNVSVLQNLTESEELASATACQFLRKKCENSGLVETVVHCLGMQNAPSDSELAQRLSFDASARTVLEVMVAYKLQQGAGTGHGVAVAKAYEIDHLRNELEVNGQRIGVTSTMPSVVAKLTDLDLANAVVLGKGAGGSVLKALHIPTQQFMAVKTIRLDDSVMGQIVAELSVVWGLSEGGSSDHKKSPFLIHSYGVFYDQGTLYLVMEVMDGSLLDLVKSKKGLPEGICRALAYQGLSGLAFMHETLRQLHRDIKPHNILFRKHDGAVKLSDFGISSTRLETLNWNRKNTFCGTLRYMSPLAVDGSDYGYEADLWSFGATLLHLALGELPYNSDSPFAMLRLKDLPPRLPEDGRFSPEFVGFIAELCDPSGYPPSASELKMHPWLRTYTLEESRRVVGSL